MGLAAGWFGGASSMTGQRGMDESAFDKFRKTGTKIQRTA